VSSLTSDTPSEALKSVPSGSRLLASLGATIAVWSALVIVVLALGFSTQVSVLGHGSVCAYLPVDAGPGVPVSPHFAQVLGLTPGSTAAQVGPIQACASHPSSLLRLEAMLATLPSAVLAIGALVIGGRWIRSARMPNRFYTKRAARDLKLLGLYLVIGSAVVAVIESIAHMAVISTLARHVVWAPAEIRFSVITFAIGLTIVGLSYVIIDGTAMQRNAKDPRDSA
jgi:hypothetical protein